SRALNHFYTFGFYVLARRGAQPDPDLETSLYTAHERIANALLLASGVSVGASAPEVFPVDSVIAVSITVFNLGGDTITLRAPRLSNNGAILAVPNRDP